MCPQKELFPKIKNAMHAQHLFRPYACAKITVNKIFVWRTKMKEGKTEMAKKGIKWAIEFNKNVHENTDENRKKSQWMREKSTDADGKFSAWKLIVEKCLVFLPFGGSTSPSYIERIYFFSVFFLFFHLFHFRKKENNKTILFLSFADFISHETCRLSKR